MRILLVLALLASGADAATTVVVNGNCTITPTSNIVIATDTGNLSLNGSFAGTCGGSPTPPPPGQCVQGAPSHDLPTYSRQCSGQIRSWNTSLRPVWDNTFAGLFSGPWPGNVGQMGWGLGVVVPSLGYASFAFNTGSTPAGVTMNANGSYGTLATISISTYPGDFFSGTALCVGSNISFSSKPLTKAQCKLQPNTDYYLNFSNAYYSPPHDTSCTGSSSCMTGWTPYSYSN